MQEELGFSPATVSWELLAQSGAGAVEVLKVDDPLAAMVWPRDFVCTDLAMSQADQDS